MGENFVFLIAEAAVLACAVSLDAFVAGFAYGSNKIKIPFLSLQIVNIVCSTVLGLSLLAGSIIRPYLPAGLTTGICFVILFFLGATKLLDSLAKSYIRRKGEVSREVKFSAFSFNFILTLYADPEKADTDESKVLSPSEALTLAIALSLDGLVIGLGAALGNINPVAVFLFSLVSDMGCMWLGCHLGNKISRKIKFNISWISGAVLIWLAVMKIVLKSM